MASGPAPPPPGTPSPAPLNKPVAPSGETPSVATSRPPPAPADTPGALATAVPSAPNVAGPEPANATAPGQPAGVRGTPPSASAPPPASADKGGAAGSGPSQHAPALPPRLVDAARNATVGLLAGRGGGGVAEIGVGVLVDRRGYVLTPNRLPSEAQTLQVRLADGRRLPVQRVWRDPLAGVAVLKIEGGSLPALAMGDSAALRVGDAATLVYGATASAQATIRATGSAIVIDLPILGDRVGSPLIDESGRMIAISTADEASPRGAAIPIDHAKPMLRQAMTADSARSAAPSPGATIFP